MLPGQLAERRTVEGNSGNVRQGRRKTDMVIGGSDPSRKSPRILVVDDDEGIKKIVAKGLEQLPMPVEVLTASDGAEALKIIETNLVDLVILDVMMPGMDGFAVCERLRSDMRTAFIPVLMLTASAEDDHRTKGYMIGTDDYMNKPFSMPELNLRVSRLLKRTYGL
jgi:two-component system alkaline phosphatase synthesis response regulator PhoP